MIRRALRESYECVEHHEALSGLKDCFGTDRSVIDILGGQPPLEFGSSCTITLPLRCILPGSFERQRQKCLRDPWHLDTPEHRLDRILATNACDLLSEGALAMIS